MPDDLEKRLRAKLAKSIDDRITATITGGDNLVNAAPQEPLTLDKIRRLQVELRAKIGPTPVWLSSEIFPADRAWMIEGIGETFTCAHPGFWLKVEDAVRKSGQVKPHDRALNPLMLGMELRPIEIDEDEDDDQARQAMKRGHWRRLQAAVETACVLLPEWLSRAPTFGHFG